MTTREVRAIADAINQRYRNFDADGAVRFGIEEAVLAVAEIMSANHADFDATDFKHRCFSGRQVT